MEACIGNGIKEGQVLEVIMDANVSLEYITEFNNTLKYKSDIHDESQLSTKVDWSQKRGYWPARIVAACGPLLR